MVCQIRRIHILCSTIGKRSTYASSESHQSTIADKAPDGTRFPPVPTLNDLEFIEVLSSFPPLSESESMNKSRNPSTAIARDEKKLELSCAA